MTTQVETERFNCGEIFITNNYSMILECKSCTDTFGAYPVFLDHIFDHHVDNWFANSDNISTENASETQQVSAGSSNITKAAETAERFYCGGIIITKNFCMIIECNGCNGKFGVYTEFLDHIFDKHFDQWTKDAEKKTTDGEQYVVIETTIAKDDSRTEVDDEEFITEILEPMEDEAVNEIIEEVEKTPKQTASPASIKKKNMREVRKISLPKKGESDKARRYKCKICGFAFVELCNLRSHEQRHNTIKPFTCIVCEKGFYSSTELKTHLRRHNNEKPFVCPYCGKSFVTAGVLTMHEKRHTGKKEHKCKECDKSFFDAYQLKMHTAVHTKERKYECKVCDAKFGRANTLRTHMKIHENALGYECIICHMRFNQKPTLSWHIKSKHKVMNNEGDTNDLTEKDYAIDDEFDST